MSPARDDDADDLFVDHCLQQELGGVRPPDFAARVAQATAERRALAAARVDAGQPVTTTVHRGHWPIWLAAAALVLAALVASWWSLQPSAPQTLAARAQTLLDEFHAVMPRSPASLRDAGRRDDLAARALPVIHAILDLHRAHQGALLFGSGNLDFEVYGAVLGDPGIVGELRRRAADGDVAARAQLATAQIARRDGGERAQAIEELCAHLVQRPDIAGSIVQSLNAAELLPGEAERIAAVVTQPESRRYLQRSAELAAASPRRLLDQPLELFGRLADDRLFSTASLRGKVVVVCFWASWCHPSLAVVDEVRQVGREHPGVQVVGVSCDHDAGALGSYLAAHADDGWLHFFDRAHPGWHEFALSYRVQTIPFVMVLDREGVVREVDSGGDVEGAVRRLLAR